jgi:hypothetical protein
MARRLISPCQGSGLLNAGFLGVFSSHHYHRLPLSSSHRSSQLKNCYLPNLRKEVSHWTRPATPSLSLYVCIISLICYFSSLTPCFYFCRVHLDRTISRYFRVQGLPARGQLVPLQPSRRLPQPKNQRWIFQRRYS